MIINKRTNYIIEYPEEVLKVLKVPKVPKHVYLNLDLDTSEYIFIVPKEITDNTQKIIYKIGFLKKFYLLSNPKMTNIEIYKIINNEWQVFVGHRQMERHWKNYIKLFDKKKRD